MTLLRQTGFLLLGSAALMVLLPSVRRRPGFAASIVVALFASFLFVQDLKPQVQEMRLERGLEGVSSPACLGRPCQMLKDQSYPQKVDQVGRSMGLHQPFLAWAAQRIGGEDRYYLITDPKLASSPVWITYFLLPRVAVWAEGARGDGVNAPRNLARMSRADWVVVYHSPPPKIDPARVRLGAPVKFGDGYYLIKVEQ